MKQTSPNSSGRPVQLTPEAWAMQAEWRGEPPSLAREEAGKALDALGRAAEESAGGGADEIPPVPEELRARWAEVYGQRTEDAKAARPAHHDRRDRESRTLTEWLAALLNPRRLAWVGGAGAVAAALVALFFQSGDPSTGNADVAGLSPGLRGNGAPPAGVAAPIAVVAPAATSAIAPEVLKSLESAFPGRVVHVLSSADLAAAMARREPRLVVINLGSGLVTAWQDGVLADEFRAAAGTPPDRMIPQVESADERLEKGAVVAP